MKNGLANGRPLCKMLYSVGVNHDQLFKNLETLTKEVVSEETVVVAHVVVFEAVRKVVRKMETVAHLGAATIGHLTALKIVLDEGVSDPQSCKTPMIVGPFLVGSTSVTQHVK